MKAIFALSKLSQDLYRAYPEGAYPKIRRKESRPYAAKAADTTGDCLALFPREKKETAVLPKANTRIPSARGQFALKRITRGSPFAVLHVFLPFWRRLYAGRA